MSFDPNTFLAEAPAGAGEDFNPDEFLGTNSAPTIGSNWDRLLGGLDGMDARLGPEERDTFAKLDAVSGNPKQARAQAINQAWVKDKHPEIDHANLELNWPTIRTAYARETFGSLEPDVSDVTLYGLISKRHTDAGLAEAQAGSQIKEWTWEQDVKGDLRMTAKSLEKFWESINKPAWELPRAPDNLPDIPGLGMQNPALAGAVFNGLAPMFEQAVGSPLGIATLGVAAPLQAASKAYPVAKAALLGMEGIFTALMGYGTYQGAKQLPAVFNDPEATFQEKATKATEVVSMGAATLLGALGTALTAFEGRKAVQIAKQMEGKNPKEAADILRKEAETLETPAEQKPVLAAADKLEKLAPAEVVEPKPTLEQETALSPENKGVVQPLDNGGYVVTDPQGRLVGWAETAAEAKALAEGKKPTPKPVVEEPATAKVEAETESAGKTIGISNEAVNKELSAMGEAPLKEADYRAQVTDVELAFKTLKETPEAGRQLIEDLKANPRPLNSQEGAVLLAEMKRLSDERAAARASEIEAAAMGDKLAADQFKAEGDALQRRFTEASRVSKEVGTLGGRGLAFRNALLKEDNSLATLESRRAEALGQETLTPEQSAEVKDLHSRLEAAEAALAGYKKKAAAPRELTGVRKTLAQHADEARARISARLEKIATSGLTEGEKGPGLLSAENLNDLGIVGADYLARGATKLAEWSEAMVREFGEKIRPHLQAIFEKSHELRKDESRLSAKKTRLAHETEALKKKVAEKDFAPKEKPKPLHLDEEANRLQAERDFVKLEYEALLERDRYEKMTRGEKIKQGAADLYDNARNIMTTGEFSFIGRQGLFASAAHPIKAARALPDMVRAFLSDSEGAHAVNLKTLNDPLVPAAKEAGLFLIESGARLSKQEEAFMGRIANAKGVGGKAKAAFDWTVGRFNQAGTAFLNRLRLDSFKAMQETGLTPAEQKQLATYVNESTGRGGLGKFEASGVLLSRLLFAPRFLVSRFQYALGHSMWDGTGRSRRIIAKQYARTALGLSAYYTLMELAFNEDENNLELGTDPLSPDFGKLRMGNTRIDPLAGVSQALVYTARTINAANKAVQREIHPERREELTKGAKWTDTTARFVRSKGHPIPSTVANLFDGTTLGGEEATAASEAVRFGGPLTYIDIYEAFKEQDMDDATAIALLAVLGVGVQNYEKKTGNAQTAPARQ